MLILASKPRVAIQSAESFELVTFYSALSAVPLSLNLLCEQEIVGDC